MNRENSEQKVAENNDTDQIQTVFIRNRKKEKLSWYTYF